MGHDGSWGEIQQCALREVKRRGGNVNNRSRQVHLGHILGHWIEPLTCHGNIM